MERADHYKKQIARIAEALRAAGIDKFEETDEVVHIPTVRDAQVRVRAGFKRTGDVWNRQELFDKPCFQVDPIGVPNGRRTNHPDPAKAAAKAVEHLRAATANQHDENFWIAQNERVAALIAPAVAKFDERASKFGWRVRHIHVAGFKGYGKLELFQPDPERPNLTFLERRGGDAPVRPRLLEGVNAMETRIDWSGGNGLRVGVAFVNGNAVAEICMLNVGDGEWSVFIRVGKDRKKDVAVTKPVPIKADTVDAAQAFIEAAFAAIWLVDDAIKFALRAAEASSYRKTDGREGNCADCAASWWDRNYSQWQCPRRGLNPVDARHVCDAFSDRQAAEDARVRRAQQEAGPR